MRMLLKPPEGLKERFSERHPGLRRISVRGQAGKERPKERVLTEKVYALVRAI